MTLPVAERRTFDALDEPTRALVRLSATIAAGHEQVVRDELAAAHKVVPAEWIAELILQSYLFAGFPRAVDEELEVGFISHGGADRPALKP